MVNVTTIQTFYHKLARESKVFANLKGFFIDILTCEVFSDATVVCVAQLYFVNLMVKQVVDVNVVYIALYV